jgi:LacI family transcriptional regulator
VRVPEEIAVAGFDDIPIARFASPPLSTVRLDIRTLGERAAAWLLVELSGEGSSPAVREVLPIRLVLRESTGGREEELPAGPPLATSVSRFVSSSSPARRRKAS